jgi:hypothetical protein
MESFGCQAAAMCLGAPIVAASAICEHEFAMDTPSEHPADAPVETPPDEQKQPSAPSSFLKFERGDLLPFCLVIGFSTWLWSHASASLGWVAILIGAAIGLAVACLVRTFC